VQKLIMFQRAIRVHHVHGPLEWQLLVRGGAGVERDGGRHRLKVQVASRWAETVEPAREVRSDKALPGGQRVPDSRLLDAKCKIRRHGRNALNTLGSELLGLPGRQPRQKTDPVAGLLARQRVLNSQGRG